MHHKYSYCVICSHCRARQQEIGKISDILDAGYCASDRADLYDGSLNMLQCEYCGKTFRYETELLAFDAGRGYAVMAMPRHKGRSRVMGAKQFLSVIGADRFRFRLVRYCVQLMEKVRIFDAGLDDRVIELVKQEEFGSIALPPGDSFLLFRALEDDRLLFHTVDEDDRTVEWFSLNYEIYRRMAARYTAAEPASEHSIIWHMIDKIWATQHCLPKEEDH